MILGVGTDIIQIPRIEKIIKKYTDNRLAGRILSAGELHKWQTLNAIKQCAFIAKRFVAKEAFSKAIGSGIRGNLRFKDINVYNDIYGKPKIEVNHIIEGILYEKISLNSRMNLFLESQKADILRKVNIDISIADDYPVALAFVVISLDSNNTAPVV